MSTAVFCIALEKALRKLKLRGYILVVYCDDLVIAHRPEISAILVTQHVQEEFRQIGLTINTDKKLTTEDQGTIKFLD